MPHILSHACPSQCSALMICHACIRWYGLPGSEPTCETRLPRAPVSPVEPLAPASSRNASHLVRCLPISAQSSEGLPCLQTLVWKGQSLNPPVRPVCPEAPVWPVETAHPCKQSKCLTLCHMPALPSAVLSWICHACIRWYGLPGSEPTCGDPSAQKPRSRLWSRSPLQAVAILTYCQIPALLCASEGLPCLHTLVWKARV